MNIIYDPDTIFVYDGTVSGFYTCVREAFHMRHCPFSVVSDDEWEPGILPMREIETSVAKAQAVRDYIGGRISPRVLELSDNVFFSHIKDKEITIIRFLFFAYKKGADCISMLGERHVAAMLAAEKHIMGEAHLLKGFVRFSDYGGFLAAVIEPKNFILPFIADHFIARFNCERFMIFDKSHSTALIWDGTKYELVSTTHIAFPEADEKENKYRALWKSFYNTVAIAARENPRCRMTHMPKRYWANMLEVSDLLN